MPQDIMQEENFISLADMLRLIFKHKLLVLILFILFFALGSVYILKQKKQYTYKQQFVLSHYYDGSQYLPIASRDAIESQLQNYVLPQLISDYNSKNPNRQLSITKFQNAISSSKATPYSIDFTMKLPLAMQDKQLFSLFANQLFKAAKKIELSNVEAFKNNLNSAIDLINKQLPSLQQLQKMQMKIDELMPKKLKNKAGLAEIRDMYISSLGANSNYNQLYSLMTKLRSSQEKLSTIQLANQTSTVLIDSGGIGKLTMLILLLFVSLLLSLLCTFSYAGLKNSLSEKN